MAIANIRSRSKARGINDFAVVLSLVDIDHFPTSTVKASTTMMMMMMKGQTVENGVIALRWICFKNSIEALDMTWFVTTAIKVIITVASS